MDIIGENSRRVYVVMNNASKGKLAVYTVYMPCYLQKASIILVTDGFSGWPYTTLFSLFNMPSI